MTLNKIDFLFKNGNLDFYDDENHYQRFVMELATYVKNIDISIINDWKSVRDNSLIIIYEYTDFYEELISFIGENNLHFFRRIFIISAALKEFQSPSRYQQKSFAGSTYHLSYNSFVHKANPNRKYPAFCVDKLAITSLENSQGDTWISTIEPSIGYEVVKTSVDIVKLLGLYFSEYMEKYDQLKDLDKFAIQEEKAVKSSWWKRIFK